MLCSRRNRDYLQMAKHQKTHRNTPAESVWSSQNKQRFCVGCSYEASGGRTQTTKSGVGQKIENYSTDKTFGCGETKMLKDKKKEDEEEVSGSETVGSYLALRH